MTSEDRQTDVVEGTPGIRTWGTRIPGGHGVRIAAAVTGLLGFLLAVLTPLLPVNQSTAELNWPQGSAVGNVAAPLVAFVPIDMDVAVPCSPAAELPASGGVLLSTLPEGGQQASARALFILSLIHI